jgi:hypothetical protein
MHTSVHTAHAEFSAPIHTIPRAGPCTWMVAVATAGDSPANLPRTAISLRQRGRQHRRQPLVSGQHGASIIDEMSGAPDSHGCHVVARPHGHVAAPYSGELAASVASQGYLARTDVAYMS